MSPTRTSSGGVSGRLSNKDGALLSRDGLDGFGLGLRGSNYGYLPSTIFSAIGSSWNNSPTNVDVCTWLTVDVVLYVEVNVVPLSVWVTVTGQVVTKTVVVSSSVV